MKTKLLFTLLMTSVLSFGQNVYQLPIYEGFDYLESSLLIDHTTQTAQGPWTAQSWTNSTNNPMVIASPFTTQYTDLPAFTGKALRIVGSGNDPIFYYPSVLESSGTNLYASCMLYVEDILTATQKDYVMALTTPGFGYGAALYFSIINATTYQLGINESNTSAEAQIYTGATYTAGVDKLFIVIKYEFNSTGNSVAHLFINPTINGAIEPAATINTSALTLLDEGNKTEFSILKLNINGNSRTPSMAIDEIRVGTSWLDVVSTTNPPTTLSVAKNKLADNFKVYPNPANDHIYFESRNEKIESISIYNVMGEHIIFKKGSVGNSLNISTLSKGVYFVEVNGEKSGKVVKRIVVN